MAGLSRKLTWKDLPWTILAFMAQCDAWAVPPVPGARIGQAADSARPAPPDRLAHCLEEVRCATCTLEPLRALGRSPFRRNHDAGATVAARTTSYLEDPQEIRHGPPSFPQSPAAPCAPYDLEHGSCAPSVGCNAAEPHGLATQCGAAARVGGKDRRGQGRGARRGEDHPSDPHA